jgi:hypothetical protein
MPYARHFRSLLAFIGTSFMMSGCGSNPAATNQGRESQQKSDQQAKSPIPEELRAIQSHQTSPAKQEQKPQEIKEFTADDLAREQQEWNNKYVGTRLRVSGDVGMVYPPYVYLTTKQKSKTGQDIKVVLKFGDEKAAKAFAPRQKVLAEGKGTSAGIFGPGLEECQLIKVLREAPKEEPPQKFAAVDLSKAYVENKAAADKKFLSKKLVVTGVAKEVSINKDGDASVTLMGTKGGMNILCSLASRIPIKDKVKTGQTLTISGTCMDGSGFFILLGYCKIEE